MIYNEQDGWWPDWIYLFEFKICSSFQKRCCSSPAHRLDLSMFQELFCIWYMLILVDAISGYPLMVRVFSLWSLPSHSPWALEQNLMELRQLLLWPATQQTLLPEQWLLRCRLSQVLHLHQVKYLRHSFPPLSVFSSPEDGTMYQTTHFSAFLCSIFNQLLSRYL